MVYFKLISGVVLLVVFLWLLFKTRKTSALGIFYDAIKRFDIQIGVFAGLYLIATSLLLLLL